MVELSTVGVQTAMPTLPPQLSHHQNFSLQFARVTYKIIIDIIDIDDTKLWQPIKNYGDNRQLQNDLHSLEHWSE